MKNECKKLEEELGHALASEQQMNSILKTQIVRANKFEAENIRVREAQGRYEAALEDISEMPGIHTAFGNEDRWKELALRMSRIASRALGKLSVQHEWKEMDGLPVCEKCGMVKSDSQTACKGELPKIVTRDAPEGGK